MTITIYSTTACAACQTLTKWLDTKGYAYTKKVTDEDPAIMAEFMQVNDGMIGVPFTIITDDAGKQTKLSGFNQAEFVKAL
jgi:glutaredoxin